MFAILFWFVFNCKSEIFAQYRCIFIFYKGCLQDGAGAPSGTGTDRFTRRATGWCPMTAVAGAGVLSIQTLSALGLVTVAAPRGPLEPQDYKVLTSPLAINFYDICTSISLISLTCLQILPQFLVQSSHSTEVYKTEHKLSWLLCLQGQMTHLLLNSVGWSILHLSSNIYIAIHTHTHTHTHRKASWIKLMLYTPLLKQDRNWKLWCATFLKE